jgi:hypothetical protein
MSSEIMFFTVLSITAVFMFWRLGEDFGGKND